jgi:ketosteroid isomerase-like protein
MSKKHPAFITFLLILGGLAFAQSPAKEARTDDSDELDVRALEMKRVEALVRGDLKVLDSILDDDLVYIHSSGLVDTKASFIDSLKSGALKYLSMEHDDIFVKMLPGVAMIRGKTAVSVRAGGPDGELRKLKLRFTCIYAKRTRSWKMVHWQSTRFQD